MALLDRRDGLDLPAEVLLHIIECIQPSGESQPTLHAFALVCRSWYSAVIGRLYHSPWITGKNFDAFIATVCPSVNAHVRKSDLAEMVHRLDLSRLVHHGSKSLLARLLRRVRDRLELFVAPATTFSTNSHAALSKCHNLRSLNLEFVSEYVDLVQLFASISKLPRLERLHLSRTTVGVKDELIPPIRWPPNLEHLTLSGRFSGSVLGAGFLFGAPNGLKSFRIDNPIGASVERLMFSDQVEFQTPFGQNLRSLELCYVMDLTLLYIDFYHSRGGHVLIDHPHLLHLTLHVSWITELFALMVARIEPSHPLESFKILGRRSESCHGHGSNWELEQLSQSIIAGGLHNLRRVYISSDLICNSDFDPANTQEEGDANVENEAVEEDELTAAEALADLMDALETEKAEQSREGYMAQETGVWVIPSPTTTSPY